MKKLRVITTFFLLQMTENTDIVKIKISYRVQLQQRLIQLKTTKNHLVFGVSLDLHTSSEEARRYDLDM